MSSRCYHGLKLWVILFLLVSVVGPLLALAANIRIADIQAVVGNAQFLTMLGHSLLATSIATVLSVSLAFLLAWCVHRSQIRGASVFSILFAVPMLIPSISHGMGLVLLLGDNGILTNAFGINIGLYGYPGIIIGSILYSFPVAFLMLTDMLQYEDQTTYEAAQVLGLSRFQQFSAITLPNMKGALLSAVFAVFTMVFTDYGVPLVVGGKIMTLPVYMYREVIGLLDFSKGAIIGVILLLPAFIAFIVDRRNDTAGNAAMLARPYIVQVNKKRDVLCYIGCITMLILISLPIIAFVCLALAKQYPLDMSVTLANWQEALQLGAWDYFKNALAIALVTSLLGMCLLYFTAFLTARSPKTLTTSFLHLISMMTLAIPGVVLGLCYVLFFKGSFLYGSLAILILVNTVHFFASPYLLAYNSLRKFHGALDDTAAVMGISRMRMLLDVYVPCTRETLLEMFSYLFVNCMVTISAVSFLANFKTMPLALLIPQFDAQSLIEPTAVVSLMILLVNGVLKLGIYLVRRHIRSHAS